MIFIVIVQYYLVMIRDCLSILPYFLWCDVTCYLTIRDVRKLGVNDALACILKENDWKYYFLERRKAPIAIVIYSPNAVGCVDNRLHNFWKYACCNYTIDGGTYSNMGNLFSLIEHHSRKHPGLTYKAFIKEGSFYLDLSTHIYDYNQAYYIDIIGSKTGITNINSKYLNKSKITVIVIPQYFSLRYLRIDDFGFVCRSIDTNYIPKLHITKCVFDRLNIYSSGDVSVTITSCILYDILHIRIESYMNQYNLPTINYIISRNKFIGNEPSIFFVQNVCHESSTITIIDNVTKNNNTITVNGKCSIPMTVSSNIIINCGI